MTVITGGCACGSVRYEYAGEPESAFHCCCRQCQRATGGGHASFFVALADRLAQTGDLKFFDVGADSGNTVSRGYCSRCGNPVMGRSTGYPGRWFVNAATLDDPALFVPEEVTWTAERQPWDHLDPRLAAS